MTMIRIEKKVIQTLMVLFVWIGFLPASAQAQPGRNGIINDVQITDKAECAVLLVEFNLPVKYKKHFPEGVGKELRIFVEAVIATEEERQQVNRNEYISPPKSDIVAITEIFYEGEDMFEPYLTILFAHPVEFAVRQGNDFRSLIISVFLPGSQNGCRP